MAEWFKQRVGYYKKPEMQAAGEAAEVLHLRAKDYCAEFETGGYIPASVLPMLTPKGWKQRAAALVAVGLWERTQAGYAIADWDEDQAELEALAARKRSDRDRQRARRQRLKDDQSPPRPPHGTDYSRDESADASRDASRDNTGHDHDGPVKEKQKPETYPPVERPAIDPDGADVIPLYPTGFAGQSTALPQMSRDGHVTRHADGHAPIEIEKENYPPNPPHSGGNSSPPRTRCTRHLARPKTWCPDCQRPPLEPVPLWCGKCDSAGFRWLLNDDGQPVRKCPRCHPETVRYA